MTTSTAALIFARVSKTHSARTSQIALDLDVAPRVAVRHLRALVDAGFLFCEDDFDGRARDAGRFGSETWSLNYEGGEITAEIAEELIAEAARTGKNGRDVVDERGLGI